MKNDTGNMTMPDWCDGRSDFSYDGGGRGGGGYGDGSGYGYGSGDGSGHGDGSGSGFGANPYWAQFKSIMEDRGIEW